MIELAEIFGHYSPTYREKFGECMLLRHRLAMAAIEQCRTEAMGGHVYHCEACNEALYSYHSCKNRHCPKCQNKTAEQWLVEQRELLLPTPYFMVTFTLPADLKRLARSNQKTLYNILLHTSAAALRQWHFASVWMSYSNDCDGLCGGRTVMRLEERAGHYF